MRKISGDWILHKTAWRKKPIATNFSLFTLTHSMCHIKGQYIIDRYERVNKFAAKKSIQKSYVNITSGQ